MKNRCQNTNLASTAVLFRSVSWLSFAEPNVLIQNELQLCNSIESKMSGRDEKRLILQINAELNSEWMSINSNIWVIFQTIFYSVFAPNTVWVAEIRVKNSKTLYSANIRTRFEILVLFLFISVQFSVAHIYGLVLRLCALSIDRNGNVMYGEDNGEHILLCLFRRSQFVCVAAAVYALNVHVCAAYLVRSCFVVYYVLF